MKKEIFENLRVKLLQIYLEENRNNLVPTLKNVEIMKGGEMKNEA